MDRKLMLSAAIATLLPALGMPAAALTQGNATETVVVQGDRTSASPDICLKIADAKIKQWAQRRILRDRTDLFADGETRKSEFIFTENTLYFHIGEDWRAGPVGWSERSTEDPQAVAKRMKLTDCGIGASVQENGRSVTRFTYSQGADSASRLWVSDATGLPLRMEIDQKPTKPNQPVMISFRYAYDDAVKVPGEVALALNARERRSRAELTALQLRHAGW